MLRVVSRSSRVASLKRLGFLGGGMSVLSYASYDHLEDTLTTLTTSALNLRSISSRLFSSFSVHASEQHQRPLGISLKTDKKRLIIIGDVHGCIDELKELLMKCGYEKNGEDLVIFVGDLVGKGPRSLDVVEYVKDELKAPCVKGNHDHYILECRDKVKSGKAKDYSYMHETHREVTVKLAEEQWKWFEDMPYYIEIPDFNAVVVHGGFAPGVPWEKQDPENLMYIRSLTKNGMPTSKIEPDTVPWAAAWTGPRHVVFGHDARRGIQRYPLATGLDSGCCYGRQLSALILPDNRIVSVKARKVYSPPDVALNW